MSRPIDTQVIYSQSPNESSRQHVSNQQPALQQDQFANIMHKETENKKDTVFEVKDEVILDNNLEKRKNKKKDEQQLKEKKEKDKKSSKHLQNTAAEGASIDIRI